LNKKKLNKDNITNITAKTALVFRQTTVTITSTPTAKITITKTTTIIT